jgi:hypothetical protein
MDESKPYVPAFGGVELTIEIFRVNHDEMVLRTNPQDLLG